MAYASPHASSADESPVKLIEVRRFAFRAQCSFDLSGGDIDGELSPLDPRDVPFSRMPGVDRIRGIRDLAGRPPV